jgi:hypothetical protein
MEVFQPPPRDKKKRKFPAAVAEKNVGLHLHSQRFQIFTL